jgi:hypothetical protein
VNIKPPIIGVTSNAANNALQNIIHCEVQIKFQQMSDTNV